MKKTVLVLGAAGQLGRSLRWMSSRYPLDIYFSDRTDLDLTNENQIRSFFLKNSFDFVVNAAAYTSVDSAEKHKELAEVVNHSAVASLAMCSANQNAEFFHISTDYVFDGDYVEPISEQDPVNPRSVYGQTKLRGEIAALDLNPKTTVIRTSWLYSNFGNNFLNTILRIASENKQIRVVNDQVGCPTYALDLARAVLDMISQKLSGAGEERGVFHYSNHGSISWFDFASAIVQNADLCCEVIPISSLEYPTEAPRPAYSVLSTERIIKHFNVETPHWRKALGRCMEWKDKNER